MFSITRRMTIKTIINMENPDILRIITPYVGDQDYICVATLSRSWREAWGDKPRTSCVIGHGTTPGRLSLAFENYVEKTLKLTRQVVKIGRLDLLKICRSNGCPWNKQVFSDAARSGNLEIIKYLKENGCPCDEWVCSQAARWGHLEVLKFLIENDFPQDEWTDSEAARGGHIEILKYLKEQGVELDEFTIAGAARGGHTKTINFLMRDGCPVDQSIVYAAAKGGHAEIFETYVEQHGWDDDTIRAASYRGHVNILQILKEKGAKWKANVLTEAMLGNELSTAKYLIQTGCPFEVNNEIVEWLEYNIEQILEF